MASLVDPRHIYKFRMASTALAISSNGSGIAAGYETCDPSGGGTWTATEWASLTGLFNQVRCSKFVLHCVKGQNVASSGTGATPYIVFGSTLATPTGAPGTVGIVWDNSDAKVHCPSNVSGSGMIVHAITLDKSFVDFASIATPNPGSYAGCPGGILYYGANFSNGMTVLQYFLEGFYELQSRS